jgi:hypothetical protein
MRRFLTWWLAIAAFMLLLLGVAGLAVLVATLAARANPWVGLSVMLLFVSALTAGGMVWTSGPTPPWFKKLITRLQ